MKRLRRAVAWTARYAISLAMFGTTASFAMAWGLHLLRIEVAGLLVVLPLVWLVVVLHEGGHYLAARWQGMHVLSISILGWEIQPLRRGLRLRRSLPGKRSWGQVIAIARLAAPERRQLAFCVLGGPLANLVVGSACALLAWSMGLPPGSEWLAAFATLNLGIGLFNLVPWQDRSTTDGALLLLLWRNPREFAEQQTHARIIARLLEGTLPDALPEQELEWLERQPTPLPLVALWYRLKALHCRNDWTAARAIRERLDAMEACTPDLREQFPELLNLMYVELAFSQAMQEGDCVALRLCLPRARSCWVAPWLLPRCEALLAALAGDRPACAALLQVAEQRAERSTDASARLSESLLRHAVAARNGMATVG